MAWLLLLPLSFNGVRMVCVEAAELNTAVTEKTAATGKDAIGGSSAAAEAEEDCATICLREGHRTPDAQAPSSHPESDGISEQSQPGGICLLAPNTHVSCDHVLSFAVAVPAPSISANDCSGRGEVVREATVRYLNPSPPVWPPPPKT
jgi:hypothetical protein